MTPFGVKLRQIRAERGITLKQMAESLGVSPAYLSSLEHGLFTSEQGFLNLCLGHEF